MLAVLVGLVEEGKAHIAEPFDFRLLLVQEEAAADLLLQVVVACLMLPPVRDGPDSRLHVLQLLEYFLNRTKE